MGGGLIGRDAVSCNMSLYCIDEGMRGVVGKLRTMKVGRVRATTPVPCSGLELENHALKNELRRRMKGKAQPCSATQLTSKLDRPLTLLRNLEAESRECAFRSDEVDELLTQLERTIKKSPRDALLALEELKMALLSVQFQSESSELQVLREENQHLRAELELYKHKYRSLAVEKHAPADDSVIASICTLLQQRVNSLFQDPNPDVPAFVHIPLHLSPALKALVRCTLEGVLQLASKQTQYLQTIQHLSNEVIHLRSLPDLINCSSDTVELFKT